MIVFIPQKDDKGSALYPSQAYERAANVVRELAEIGNIDCEDTQQIKRYYQMLYQHSDGDASKLCDAIERENYPEVETAYRMIADGAVQVIVPYAPLQDLYEKVRDAIDAQHLTKKLLNEAKTLTVSTFAQQRLSEVAQNLPNLGFYSLDETGKQLYFLGNAQYYDSQIGLNLQQDDEWIL